MKRIFFFAALLLAAVPSHAQMMQSITNDVHHSGGAAFTTFDPSNDLWHVTLSGGNLTATNATCTAGTGYAFCGARGTSPTTHGGTDKVYFEATVSSPADNHIAIGFQSGSYVPSGAFSIIGFDSNSDSVGYDASTNAAAIAGTTFGTWSVCNPIPGINIVGIAIDFGTKLIWERCWTGSAWSNWNNNASADPVAEVLGNSFSALSGTSPYYIGMGGNTAGDSVTINVGATSFAGSGSPPTGYSAWH